jgi:lipid-binding SYLF domain-containing protein
MAASIGFQFDAQTKIIILVFMQKNALDKFQNSDGWKVGVDRSVALVTLDAGDSLDTLNIKDPIVEFVLGQKGLMYNQTLESSKYTKIAK